MFRTVAFVAALAISSLAFSQNPTHREAARVTVTGVKLGSHVNTDLSVPVPKTIFKPTDTIHVSVATHADHATPGTLGVLWTYGAGDDLQAVHDESQEVAFDGEGQTVFEISKPDNWPVGQYHVEIFLNGESVTKVGFTVR